MANEKSITQRPKSTPRLVVTEFTLPPEYLIAMANVLIAETGRIDEVVTNIGPGADVVNMVSPGLELREQRRRFRVLRSLSTSRRGQRFLPRR